MNARLANIATLMCLTPLQAVAVPALVSLCAQKANLSEDEMIAQIERNLPLRSYLSYVCKKAMQ